MFEKAKMVEIDGYFHSAPGLLVEVLSPGNTRAERDEKIRDYESLGVPELWVVSTGKRTVEIMQLTPAQKLEKIAIANRGQIRPKLFPQAVVKIAAILAWLTAFSPNIRD